MSTKWQMRSLRKKTGGMVGKKKKHKRYQRCRASLHTFLDERRTKTKRTKGGGSKRILMASKFANVIVDGKCQKAEIKTVSGNPADRDFVRRNIMTKGAVIETNLGKAVVTSRPGQDGTINAKLVKSK